MLLQLLLGYLPPDPSEWDEVLARKRTEYLLFCEVRHNNGNREGEAGKRGKREGGRQAGKDGGRGSGQAKTERGRPARRQADKHGGREGGRQSKREAGKPAGRQRAACGTAGRQGRVIAGGSERCMNGCKDEVVLTAGGAVHSGACDQQRVKEEQLSLGLHTAQVAPQHTTKWPAMLAKGEGYAVVRLWD